MKMHQLRPLGLLGLHQSGQWGQSQSGRCLQLDLLDQNRLGQLGQLLLTQSRSAQSGQDRLLGQWGQQR